MPANVFDARGHNRPQTRTAYNKGARATLRTFEATHANRTRQKAIPQPVPAESWWLGLSREAFAAQIASRQPRDPDPVLLPDPDPA